MHTHDSRSLLSLDDVAYLRGPLLERVSMSHAVTALAAIIMTAIMIISLIYRSRQRVLYVPWSSLSILFVYGALVVLLYRGR